MLYCNGRRGRSIGDIILMDRVPLLLMVGMGMVVMMMMMAMMMVVMMMTVVVMMMATILIFMTKSQ